MPNLYHPGKMSVAVDFDLGNRTVPCERDKRYGEALRLSKETNGRYRICAYQRNGPSHEVARADR